MRVPSSFELNELNHVLIRAHSLSLEEQPCSLEALVRLCSSVVLGGRIVDYVGMVRLCKYAGLLRWTKGSVSITPLGRDFLALNPEGRYEVTAAQRHLIADSVILRGPWESQARHLFLSFSPDYDRLTFEMVIVECPDLVRQNALISLLRVLGVIEAKGSVLSVSPAYVVHVIQLRAEHKGITEIELSEMLEANRRLGDQAEDAVVEYERKRLKSLGRIAEAQLVRRISQLDIGAGYDIESFDGDEPRLQHNRFIEVKASQHGKLRFFFSSNELTVASQLGDSYWLYFVGDFSQSRRSSIAPIMIQNPARRLFEMPSLKVEPSQYLVSEQTALPLKLLSIQDMRGYVL